MFLSLCCLLFLISLSSARLHRKDTGEEIPLKQVVVNTHIVDFLAKVSITQTYENSFDQPLEATYTFPIVDGCSITEFTALVDGRVIRGVAKEKTQAKVEYIDAVSKGHTAALLEQERGDIFTAIVGNVPVRGKVQVTITYLTRLSLEGDALRFTLPTFISERYIPSSNAYMPDGRRTADVINPPVSADAHYGLSFVAEVEMSSNIRSISSPSHPIKVSPTGNKATVELGTKSTALTQDLVILLVADEAGQKKPHVWLEDSRTSENSEENPSYAALVSFYPQLQELSQKKKEIVFIFDKSGSMSDKIVDARNALIKGLKDLLKWKLEHPSVEVNFNIIPFCHDFSLWNQKSQPLTVEAIENAISFVGSIQDGGGTALLGPLNHVFGQNYAADVELELIIMTDGEISNTEQVLELVKSRKNLRVFTIGIGRAVSTYLVNGLARVGNGVAEYVIPGEGHQTISDKVQRHIHRATAAQIQMQGIRWGDNNFQSRVPSTFPTLSSSTRIDIFTMVDQKLLEEDIVVSTSVGDLTFKPEITVIRENIIHKMFARERIRELEELYETSDSSEEIISLATRWNLMSQHTSFLAIDETAPVEQQPMIKFRVPQTEETVGRMYDMYDGLHAKAHFASAPVESLLLLDVTDLSYGIETANGLMSVIIQRNTNIPTKKTVVFTTHVDNQANMLIKVYIGERRFARDCFASPTSLLVPLPLLPKGQVKVSVTMEIDVNGIPSILVEEESSGLSIEQPIGGERLSYEEIERMVRESEDKMEEDQKLSLLVPCGELPVLWVDDKI